MELHYDDLFEVLDDFDCVVAEPLELFVPMGIFCTTVEAFEFQALMKKRHPKSKWAIVTFGTWRSKYRGEDNEQD